MEVDVPAGPGPPCFTAPSTVTGGASSPALFTPGLTRRPCKRRRWSVLKPSSCSPPPRDVFPVILACSSTSLSSFSPKELQPLLQTVCGSSSFTFRPLAGGDLIVYADLPAACAALLRVTQLGSSTVSASLPACMRSKGILRGVSRDFDCSSLQSALQDYSVSAVRFLCQCGRALPSDIPASHSHSFVVEFSTSTLPDTVVIFSQLFRVSLYKEKPLLCGNCFRYGHRDRTCSLRLRCSRCGAPHPLSACTAPADVVCCLHCKGAHLTGDSSCPTRQKETLKVRTAFRLGVAYRDALVAAPRSVPCPPALVPPLRPPVPLPPSSASLLLRHASTQTDDLIDSSVQTTISCFSGPHFPPSWLEVPGATPDFVFNDSDCAALIEHFPLHVDNIVTTLYDCQYHHILLFLAFLVDASVANRPLPDIFSGAA